MNTQAQLIKEATLTATIAQSFLKGQIQSENDLITLSRVVMTDLGIGFQKALQFVNNAIEITNKVIDVQLAN